MGYIDTMEHYPPIIKKEMISFVATRLELEMIILREVGKTEKEKYCVISLICRI